MAKGVQFSEFANSDKLASQISDLFTSWESMRSGWKSLVSEARNYVFATSTRTTSTNALPWKNSVHNPKLCQIRDSLHATLLAAVIPNEKTITWEGDDETSATKDKRNAIRAYMANKLRQSKFSTTLSSLLYDLIDYGNMFAMPEYVVDRVQDENSKEMYTNYVGPRLVRISPEDIVFDPTCTRFEDTSKIIRSVKSIADLKIELETHQDKGYYQEVFDKVLDLRDRISRISHGEIARNSMFQVDGFSSFMDYFKSDYVECLDFYGDIYDPDTKELHRNRVITVVDRAYIIRNEPLTTWLGKPPIFHAGWRLRPDNLYAMGPLDNIVGLQYRIDHLENAKADGIDLIIHPVLKIKGSVEDFEYGPNARIYTSEEGDVEFMHPDATILQLDTQIMMYEQKMEEMVGMPRHAQGFRTPGEKTAYEMQMLDQAANKPFINRAAYIEEIFIEPALNALLEIGRRNLGPGEWISVEDQDFNYIEFMKLTKNDLVARGKIRPVGARRFARNANLLQTLTQFSASPIYMDPAVSVHFSGKKIATLVEELLDIHQYGLVTDNIRVIEATETQKLQSEAQQIMMEQGQVPQGPPGSAPQAVGSAPKQPVGGAI